MSDVTSPTPPPATSLRQKTTTGMIWLGIQMVATRGVTFFQQFVLVWLIAKEDFGLIGLAYTVTMFVNLLSNPGIDAVLIQRHRRYRQWATPAFWLGISVGLAGSAILLAAAPVAAWAYGRSELTGLILVLAIVPPLQALQIVPRARLQMEMRIKPLVQLGVTTSVLTAVLTIIGAALGMGAYSFVVPVPIVSMIIAAMAWRLARPPLRPRLEISRWRYLFADSAALGGSRVMHTIVGQGDRIGLGLANIPDASIGIYFVAYKLSTQTFLLLASSVPTVLFPSLSKLSLDPELQLRSTRRATRLLALVTIPFCLLQMLLAGPVIRLACPPGWADAILPLQILTLGILITSPSWPMQSLMMSQRRFQKLFKLSVSTAVVFCALIAIALAVWPGIVSVATAVALWYFWCTPVFWVAAHRDVPFFDYYREIARPLGAGVVASLPCVLLLSMLPDGKMADAIALAAIPAVFCCIFVIVARRLARADCDDFVVQIAPFWRRWFGRPASQTDAVQPKV
jgi:PST family polysaccharide transporter